MKEIPLSHFFPWGKINDDFVANILCEFADNYNIKIGISRRKQMK